MADSRVIELDDGRVIEGPPISKSIGRHDLAREYCYQHPGEWKRLDPTYANRSFVSHVHSTWGPLWQATSRARADGSGIDIWVRYTGPRKEIG